MALMTTPICEFGKPASDFSLPGVDGQIWHLQDCMGTRGLLVMFICNHCPYVKAIQQHLIQDALTLKKLGIGMVAIMSNDSSAYPEDSFSNMQRIAETLSYPFPYLLDETQAIAKAYGAICTPDFFGYNADYALQYRGRYDASGKQQLEQHQASDLLIAMSQIAETGEGPQNQIPSIGCSIKWKQDESPISLL